MKKKRKTMSISLALWAPWRCHSLVPVCSPGRQGVIEWSSHPVTFHCLCRVSIGNRQPDRSPPSFLPLQLKNNKILAKVGLEGCHIASFAQSNVVVGWSWRKVGRAGQGIMGNCNKRQSCKGRTKNGSAFLWLCLVGFFILLLRIWWTLATGVFGYPFIMIILMII